MSTISSKQDRGYARTAQDLERKYQFGKSFAEMLGLINDNRDKVDSVESSLRSEIKEQSTTLKRDAEQIVMEAKQELTESIETVSGDVSNLAEAVKQQEAELKVEANRIVLGVKEELTETIETVSNELTESIESVGEELTESINTVSNEVGDAKTELNNAIKNVDNRVTEVSNKVEMKMDASSVNILVEQAKSEVNNSVSNAKTELNDSISNISDGVSDLSNQVNSKMDADDVNNAITQEMAKGVDKVVTKTGYRFDIDGLHISKSGDEIANSIDNTGMYVKKGTDNVLVANKNGVAATDLHAKTYLIIGKDNGRSRFEDYGINRTGCFWIGG